MPKIKGWSEINPNKKDFQIPSDAITVYQSDTHITTKLIIRKPEWMGGYLVNFPSLKGLRIGSSGLRFDTKEQARHNAIQWMKRHPSG